MKLLIDIQMHKSNSKTTPVISIPHMYIYEARRKYESENIKIQCKKNLLRTDVIEINVAVSKNVHKKLNCILHT